VTPGALKQSSQGWHEGKHDPWPYINLVLYKLKAAYKEFEERVRQITSLKGAKAEMVLNAVRDQNEEFRLVDIERACPGVGREWIRALLADLKNSGEVKCRGKGPAARWVYKGRKGSTPSKGISKGSACPKNSRDNYPDRRRSRGFWRMGDERATGDSRKHYALRFFVGIPSSAQVG
jgi:hypothetical protein